MATTPVDPSIAAAAQQASGLTGLPVTFLEALIMSEQGPTQLSQTHNPFDVTVTWANLTGYGTSVDQRSLWGYGPGEWNSTGVAVFTNTSDAVAAWAKGIMTFPNYTVFRSQAIGGASVTTLAQSLQNAGYAGNSSTYVGLVGSVYNAITGLDPNNPAGPVGSVFTNNPVVVTPSASGVTVTAPTGVLPSLPTSISNPVDSVSGAINNLTNTLSTGVNNATSGIQQLHNLVTWLGQGNLWQRIILAVVGFFVLLLGLALFGISLLPKGTPLPVPVP